MPKRPFRPQALCPISFWSGLDKDLNLPRFDAAPLITFTATKETDYGTRFGVHGAMNPAEKVSSEAACTSKAVQCDVCIGRSSRKSERRPES